MQYDTITRDDLDGMAVITLRRPDVMNALNTQMRAEITHAVEAAGAGANLALVCDITIAAESASFIQAFSRIGLIPDAGGTWVLPRTVGLQKAMGAALFADRITARQAAEWGMIWEAVEDEAFDATWRARALHLASGPTEAFKRVKQAMQASFGNSLSEQLLLEGELQGQCGKTRDFKEGVVAFLEKRKPVFEGR
jgi:2-(1,2-epoxy-1,2-dihydrophenyl)acetyl-CoA isomerase